MKRIIIGTILFIIGATGSQKAQAQGAPGINHQQKKEQCSIHEGVNTGKLTRKEAVRLEGQQANIRQDKRYAKADGVIPPSERKYIKGEQIRASRNIYAQKHDDQRRF